METDILKYICSKRGAVDAVELIFNLFPGESSEVLNNNEKFVLCSSNGQEKVVARTSLRICRTRSCPGSCQALHLCKNFLLSGFCQVLQQGGICRLTHNLRSDHNQRVLKELELESLSREELCTLLLQNDNTLLPSICHDYNNGVGVLGRCQKAFDCDRLHVCEKYLSGDCRCNKTHDFYATQPSKSLSNKGVPDSLILSLREIYANKEALRFFNKGRSAAAANDSGAKSEGLNPNQRQGYRGRGRGGNRGFRGNRGSRGTAGNPAQQHRTSSFSDLLSSFEYVSLLEEDGLDQRNDFNSSNSDVSSVGNSDAQSDNGWSSDQKLWYRGRGRARGGNRGNRGRRGSVENPRSIPSLFDDLGLFVEDWLKTDGKEIKSPSSDVAADVEDSDASSGGRQDRKKNQPSAARGRGRGAARGNNQRFPGTRSTSNISAAAAGGRDEQNRKQKDKTEICMYFIKGYCKHEDRCFKAHDKLPYRWQVQEGDQWTPLPKNEWIEKDYCDPSKTSSDGCFPPVHFDMMTRGSDQVRRLSTLNSLVEPNFIHTTEWLWYWQDDDWKWHLYGADSGGHRLSDVNSAKLEQKFLDKEDVVEFTAGSQTYSLSFQDMIQTNKRYLTKRVIRRRPRFVSYVDAKKVRKTPNTTVVPDHWDRTEIPLTGFSRVVILQTSDEFKKLEAHFSSTLRGFEIIQIERIQNKALWEVFQWQKKQMKSNNGGGEVTEKQLFHGTDSKYVNAICLNNFDWRICGTHGTAFGKGSYFARDAKYSNSYTDSTGVRNMFIARVLLGSYTKGAPEYKRPPSKDGGDVNFYDSCVNDVADPSVFVVFEKHQIYPEYLLQYKTTDLLVDTVSVATVPKPKPKINPVRQKSNVTVSPSNMSHNSSIYQPSVSSYQSSTSSYQPSVSAYQPSTSSYRSSVSSYQSSISSYQPSTSSYQPSTSSYRPSTSSYQSSTLAYRPSTSSYQSSTLAYSPRTSSLQPSTLSKSSTTSSLYQTSLKAQSPNLSHSFSPRKPEPKKSDSCVVS